MASSTPLPPGICPLGFTREQAAAYLSVSVDSFDKMVDAGVMPPPVPGLGIRAKRWDSRRIRAAFDRLQGLSPLLSGDNDPDDIMEALDNA